MSLDLIGFGSAIVDFAPAKTGVPLSEAEGFVPSAGGAVSNLLVAASRLGLKTGFVGCVGDDEFGTYILRDFEKEGVDVSHVKRVEGMSTGIAFYSLDEWGERHYVFYRFPGYADPESAFSLNDVDAEYIQQSKAVHLSEAMLRKSSSRNAILEVLQISKEHGVTVSYDPNVRPALWNNRKEFFEVQRKVLRLSDIILSTSDELMLITETERLDEAIEKSKASGPSVLVVRHGDYYRVATHNSDFKVPAFKVKAVDTSGAGDAFDAGFLTGFLKKYPLDKSVELGSAVAALKIMKVGTRKGLPRLEEALQFIGKRREIP